MLESVRRLHMDGGPSSLWRFNAHRRNVFQPLIDSGSMRCNTLQNSMNRTLLHFSSPLTSSRTTLCQQRMVQAGIRDLKIPNCARTPGTHYFLGHPTHQMLTRSKIYGLLQSAGLEKCGLRPSKGLSMQELFE